MKTNTSISARAAVPDFRRMVDVPLRHPYRVLIPWLLTILAAVALSFILPKRYTSSTLILVAPDKIAESMISRQDPDRGGRRLQTMQQDILARGRLEKVVREFDPFKSLDKEPMVETLERMRKAAAVSVKGPDAFGIEFEHENPQMAMVVVDRLTTLFMEEIVGSREKQVSEAYQFIESELAEARVQLETKEKALREIKQRYMGSLPEQATVNLSAIERLQTERQLVAEQLRRATDQLALIEMAGGDITAAMGGERAGAGSPLEQARVQLAQLRTRYTDEHPDVQALAARVAELESQERAAVAGTSASAVASARGTARTRIEQARLEVQEYKTKQKEIERKAAELQNRLEQTPRIEQSIQELTRDYNKLNDNYVSLLQKKIDTQTSAKLERRWKGDQFRIVDPAFLPEKPSFPNKPLFALVGAVLGLGLGLGLSFLADMLDQSIKDIADLEATLPFPTLAVIPYVDPRQARRRFWNRRTPDEPGKPRLAEVESVSSPMARRRSTGSRQ